MRHKPRPALRGSPTSEHVSGFLRHLETERHNGIATRNARLAGLHTLSRFLIANFPEHMATFQGVLGIPFKRGTQKLPVDYLEMAEVEALLGGINQGTPSGRRDYALFALMLNTGARVQEILDLKIRDVRFDSPHQVRLLGKGNKVRLCPIWPRTAKLLQELTAATATSTEEPSEAFLFQNRRGEPLTRFGVRYLLRKYLPKRLAGGQTGMSKRLHPHSLRQYAGFRNMPGETVRYRFLTFLGLSFYMGSVDSARHIPAGFIGS